MSLLRGNNAGFYREVSEWVERYKKSYSYIEIKINDDLSIDLYSKSTLIISHNTLPIFGFNHIRCDNDMYIMNIQIEDIEKLPKTIECDKVYLEQCTLTKEYKKSHPKYHYEHCKFE